jgi:hypothetical protein
MQSRGVTEIQQSVSSRRDLDEIVEGRGAFAIEALLDIATSFESAGANSTAGIESARGVSSRISTGVVRGVSVVGLIRMCGAGEHHRSEYGRVDYPAVVLSAAGFDAMRRLGICRSCCWLLRA